MKGRSMRSGRGKDRDIASSSGVSDMGRQTRGSQAAMIDIDELDGLLDDESGDDSHDAETSLTSSTMPSVSSVSSCVSPVTDEMIVSDSGHRAPNDLPSTPVDGGSLDHLLTCGCPQCKHDLEPLPVTFDSPQRPMTRRETLLLAYAFPAKVGETTEEIAVRTGIPAPTIYRYKRREDFQGDLAEITRVYLSDHRRKVADALIEGATTPGKGQAAMQRIFWQKLGELVDTRRYEIDDPLEVMSRVLGIPKDQLPE